MTKREKLLAWCDAQLGRDYRWWAKGDVRGTSIPGGGVAWVPIPKAEAPLYDCSGFVTCALRAVGGPDWRMTHNSHSLWNSLPPTETPQPGDLAFYGPPNAVSHVMVVHSDGGVIGAAGGDRTTTTTEAARKRGAQVKRRSKAQYRPDFRGYRSLAKHLDDK